MAVLYALLLALIAVAQAQLFQTGQEIVYSYHGHVQNSIEDPTLFTSEYFINANIHIKGFNNGSLFSLQDLTYSTYLGKGKLVDETKTHPIPPETECLRLPFFVQYTLDGKVLNVLTNEDDQQWSINMKQAIASLLQLDYLQMDLTKTKPYSFNSDEQLVYGHCKIQYDIVPHNKTSSTIKKWVSSCKDQKWPMNFNVLSPGHCEASFDNSIQQNIYRTYDVEWTNKAFMINHLESDGSILFYPVSGKGGAHSVHVKQIMKKLNVSPMTDVGSFEHLMPQGVRVKLYKPNAIPGSFPDMTLGRSKVDLHNMMPKMRVALQKVVEHLKTSHVTLKEPDWTKGQTIQELLIYLRLFDTESLNHCYRIVSGTTDKNDQAMLDVFYQILPFVGTHASNIFIRDIIKTKSVISEIAVKMLQQLAFHTQFPDEVLLKELVEFSTWGSDVKQEVRGAAILCFSTLVSRVLKAHPDNAEVNGYLNHFIEEFKTAKDYYEQMLYISALQNLESLKVTKFLEPLIMNHKTVIYKVTPHLRNLAIWAAKSVHLKHPEMAHGIYWPILVNDKETLEVRTSALSVLMANPSMNSQMKIYWFMKTESDKHLYNVYYTTLKTLAASVSPCYQVSSLNSKRILHYIRRPANVTTESSVYQYDYYDSGFNMGSMIRASQVGNLMTHLSAALYVQLSSHVSNLMVNRYSTYVKLTISEHLREIVQSKMNSGMTSNAIPSTDLYTAIIEPDSAVMAEDFQLEYITLYRNHIVSVNYYNEPGKLRQLMDDFFDADKNSIKYDIAQAVEGIVLLPTDIGIPSYIYVSTPTVQKISWLYKPETLTNMQNMKIRFDMVEWNYQMYGMNVFDPITNSWHGSRRFLTVDQYLPISLDISFNTQQKTAKISFNTIPSKDMVTDHFGFQAFVQSQVYQYDMDKLKFIHYERVSEGMEHRKEHVVMDRELEDIGLHLKVAIFDCERPITPSRLIHLQREFLSNYNKNWGNLPALKMLLALRHWWAYVTLSANPGMCGMGIRFSPSIDSPATHADLTIRLVMENENVNTTTINIRSTYNLKNVDKVVKGWDANIIADLTKHLLTNTAITVTRMKPGLPDYKLCVNGHNEKNEESMSSLWNMVGGEAVNNKCPQNEMKMVISAKNELSSEQLQHSKLPIYPQCHPDTYNSLQCMMAQSSLRHYEYDAKYTNLPKEYLHAWIHFKDWLRAEYGHHFVRVFDEDKTTKEGHIKMLLDYPVATDDLNLAIYTPNGCHKYEGIPLNNWFWTGMVHPYSTLVPDLHPMVESLGMTYICQITPDSIMNQFGTHVDYRVPQEWTLYASERVDPKWKIYVKKVDETYPLAIRVVAFNDHLDIHTHGDFQFSLNDKKLPALQYGYRSNSWFDYKVHRQEHKVTLLLREAGMGVNLEYDGNKVNIHLVKGRKFTGLCYELPMTNSKV